MTCTCFCKLFLISENENTEYQTPINNNYANLMKFMKITLNSTQDRQKTQKVQKDSYL